MSTAQAEGRTQDLVDFRKPDRPVEAAGLTFHPLVTYLGGPFGHQALDVAAEVIFTHERMDDSVRGGELGLLLDRHVDPDTELPCGVFVTRQTPGEDERRDGPYVSLAMRPPVPGGNPEGGELYEEEPLEPAHAREWDFIKQHAQQALDAGGVSDAAPDAEKVHALAEYAMKFKVSPTYPSFHPVDVLLHSSYCTGAANIFAAMANVEGIPARHCCISNHTMTEVFLDGRWQFVDNHADGARFVPGSDYVDVTLEPGRFPQFSEKQRGYLSHRRTWARSPWHYSGMLWWHWAWGGAMGRATRTFIMDGYGISVPCDPHHARALYPQRDSYPFPMWDGVPEITLTEKGSWLRVDLHVQPGAALVKSYHAGRSDDNPVTGARVEWWFDGEIGLRDVVLTGAGADDLEPTELVAGTGAVTKVRFELPLDEAAEPGRHELVLTNRSERTLNAIAYPTPLVSPPAVCTERGVRPYVQSMTPEPTIY